MHHGVWVTLHLRWSSTFDDLLQLSNDLFQQTQHNASGKPPVLEKSAAAKCFLLEICVASGWQISNSREEIHSSAVSHPLPRLISIKRRSFGCSTFTQRPKQTASAKSGVLLQTGGIFHSALHIISIPLSAGQRRLHEVRNFLLEMTGVGLAVLLSLFLPRG